MTSITPTWAHKLHMQQQGVLVLAARGPDGVRKNHPCKEVVRAYRGTVLTQARFGRSLHWGEEGDSFATLHIIYSDHHWREAVDQFFATIDELPHHYTLHLIHGAEIIGYKHPMHEFRQRWGNFYLRAVDDMHLYPESEEQMDLRLNDWMG